MLVITKQILHDFVTSAPYLGLQLQQFYRRFQLQNTYSLQI